MRKIALLTFLLACLVSTLSAQRVDERDGYAIRYIGTNYQWPLEDVSALRLDDFGPGFEVEYFRSLSNLIDLSFPLRVAGTRLPQNSTGDPSREAVNIGLDGLLNLNLMKGRVFRPRVFAGVGTVWENTDDFRLDIPVGVGLNLLLSKSTFFTATAGYHLNPGVDFRDHLQVGLGLHMLIGPDPNAEPEISDRDGDGLPDDQDLCPDEAGTLALNGCPDRDGDGVTDASDDCPDTAGLPNLNGCPDGDGDGIADASDECPTEAGPAANNGCPITDRDGDGVDDENDDCPDIAGSAATAGCPDRDGDGIADKDDDCPNQPGTPANKGCPDSDNDGVIDRMDSCPNEPGPVGNKGCPEIEEEDQKVLDEAVQAIEFESGSARIRTRSYPILDQVVDILNRYPGYKASIGGHTDSIGSEESNLSLSKQRAKACYDYLISKGVSANRLSHDGYGESQPIESNMYAPGREKNRRVEFNLYIE